MIMTRKVRAYQEQKSHTAVTRNRRRRIAKLAVKRKACPSTSETLGTPCRHSWRTAPIHTPTRCGPRGDSVSEILSSRMEGLISNVPSGYRKLLLKLLADFLLYYRTKPTPEIEAWYSTNRQRPILHSYLQYIWSLED
jgi:hypothetical protein